MSDDRDALAALIELSEFGYDTERRPPSAWGYALADAILAAGWQPPRRSTFVCPRCGSATHRPGSVAKGFCRVCQDFTGGTE